MIRRFSVAVLATLLLAGCAAPLASGPLAPATVKVGIVAINDFHGALEPPKLAVPAPTADGDIKGVPAGGAAWLASAIDSVRQPYANSVTVSAGDLISASQLSSSLFLDEPTIEIMNRLGLEFNAVGNHEFDRGQFELLRMQGGGCEKFTAREPCQLEPFSGARFRFLSASTTREDGSTLFPATGLKSFGSGKGKVTIGLIGLTLKGTSDLVSPSGIRGLTFGDEADAINRAIPALKAQGADAIVVLIHQGGRTSGEPDPNGCPGLYGDIVPILDRLDTRVDVVVSGHTHWSYICDYGQTNPARPFLLTSGALYGQVVTDITLEIDPATDRVVSKKARNVIVQSEPYTSGRGPVTTTDQFPRFAPRADIAAYVARYVEAARAVTARPAGKLAGPVTKNSEGSTVGGPAGRLIADAQLAATVEAGAQIAFMNPFGIRASLVPEADGTVTFADIYAMQPFANTLVTQTMSGAALREMLEQCFDATGPEQVLTPSVGFFFAYDKSRPAGDRIVEMRLNGVPIDPAKDYRVTTSQFLADGGDSFYAFRPQREKVAGPLDIEALEAWLKGDAPRPVPSDERHADRTPT